MTVHRPHLLNYQSSSAPLMCIWMSDVPGNTCRYASAYGTEAKFPAQLQCNEICQAVLPSRLFVQDHFRAIHSHWQQRSMVVIKAAINLQCRRKQKNYALTKSMWGSSEPQTSKHIFTRDRKHCVIFLSRHNDQN